jgi:2-oxoglutarate ferredoxin oxidoreductase subunit beta
MGFSGDIKLMTRILKAAIQHRGFAFVEMLQACPTYNHFATHEYLLDRYFDANAEGHEPGNLSQARGARYAGSGSHRLRHSPSTRRHSRLP